MLKRKILKYSIYAIAILSATLINQLIVDYIKQNIHLHGYLLVLADMLVVLIILPLLSHWFLNTPKKYRLLTLKLLKKLILKMVMYLLYL